jgi:hypothetical protein
MATSPNGDNRMTKAERDELVKLVKLRERVAKTETVQRSAELLAEFERQLASVYSFDDDDVWREAHAAVSEAREKANAMIAERCRELGIPERFQPGIESVWFGRGENASKERRAELRRVAVTRINALEKAAKATIEHESLKLHTELVAGALESGEAMAFLNALPTIEVLMPSLTVAEIESTTPRTWRPSELTPWS